MKWNRTFMQGEVVEEAARIALKHIVIIHNVGWPERAEQFRLDALNTSGRSDMLARCLQSAIFLSHGTRRDLMVSETLDDLTTSISQIQRFGSALRLMGSPSGSTGTAFDIFALMSGTPLICSKRPSTGQMRIEPSTKQACRRSTSACGGSTGILVPSQASLGSSVGC